MTKVIVLLLLEILDQQRRSEGHDETLGKQNVFVYMTFFFSPMYTSVISIFFDVQIEFAPNSPTKDFIFIILSQP